MQSAIFFKNPVIITLFALSTLLGTSCKKENICLTKADLLGSFSGTETYQTTTFEGLTLTITDNQKPSEVLFTSMQTGITFYGDLSICNSKIEIPYQEVGFSVFNVIGELTLAGNRLTGTLNYGQFSCDYDLIKD